jgi:asparagine synthetase A
MSSYENTLSRSARLRKCEAVYQKYLKEQQKSSNKLIKENKEAPRTKHIVKENVKDILVISKKVKDKKEIVKSPPVKKPLNKYQMFVKSESVKDKYKGLDPKERMNLISSQWKIKNTK